MVTQKDIALGLGVSPSLVSRVLSGRGKEIGASDAVIAKIVKEAARLHYVRDDAALRLRGSRTGTLGVIAYDFEDPYFGRILGELHRLAFDRKHSIIVTGSYRRDASTLDVSPLLKHGVEGLIIVGSDAEKPWAEPFLQSGIPMIQIGFSKETDGLRLTPDVDRAVELVVAHLSALGHQRVALLFNETWPHQIFRRAYLAAADKGAIRVAQRGDLQCKSNAADSVAQSLNQIDLTNSGPTALIAGDDQTAMQAITALAARGVRVPRDMSVVGFDDIPASSLFIPALTTMQVPLAQITEVAFALATGEVSRPAKSTFMPRLVIRQSTGAAGDRLKTAL